MTTPDAHQVQAVIVDMFRAFVEHRPADIERALHPDCTIWDVFVPDLIQGRANRDRYHAADQAQSQARGTLTLNTDGYVISVWGDTALARYYVRFHYEAPNAVAGVVRITTVMRREAGHWLIVHHQEGMLPTGVPPIDTHP
jgi:ketosteroid isomerase-like protein